MTDTKPVTGLHPEDVELADFLGGIMPPEKKRRLEDHIASCDECLTKVVSAYEAVTCFNGTTKPRKGNIMKSLNIYLALAVIAFVLSFAVPRYFLQFLTATLLLGTKWVVDSKTTKMLITIYEAWKSEGGSGASRILEKMDSDKKCRF